MICADLFSGLGGWSLAARWAGGRVVWAGNHWESACFWHQRNHPEAHHVCQDLMQADFHAIPEINVLLASPSCTGHSLGRTEDKPRHDTARSTAWAVVMAAEAKQPVAVVVENVVQFLGWRLFGAWKLAMESLGYSVSPHILDAADFGVPQHRPRVFLVCTKSKHPLVLEFAKQPHRGANSFLLPYETTQNWSPVEKPGRSPYTLARVRKGREQFGERFLFPYYRSGSGTGGRHIGRPIGTLTTRARWGLCHQDHMRMLTLAENRAAMGFPADYELPTSNALGLHMLANAICPQVGKQILLQLQHHL